MVVRVVVVVGEGVLKPKQLQADEIDLAGNLLKPAGTARATIPRFWFCGRVVPV